MSPILYNLLQLLSSNLLFIVVALAPFLALAIPIPPPPAFSEPPSPESSHMDHRVIFGIVFVLVLFLAIEVGYACVGFRMPFTWFVEIYNLICAAAVIVMRRLSSLRLFRFFEEAADAIVDSNAVGTLSTRGRSGGTGNLPTISLPSISRPAPVHVGAKSGFIDFFQYRQANPRVTTPDGT